MKDQNDSNKIVNNIVGLLNTYLKLFKLEISEELNRTTKKINTKVSQVVAKLVVGFVIGISCSIFGFALVLFLSYGTAQWINSCFTSIYIGHLMVASIHLIFLGIIISLKGKISTFVVSQFESAIENKKNENTQGIHNTGERKTIERSEDIQ